MTFIWGIKTWSGARACKAIKVINVLCLYASYMFHRSQLTSSQNLGGKVLNCMPRVGKQALWWEVAAMPTLANIMAHCMSKDSCLGSVLPNEWITMQRDTVPTDKKHKLRQYNFYPYNLAMPMLHLSFQIAHTSILPPQNLTPDIDLEGFLDRR